jgi:hypothetical protein
VKKIVRMKRAPWRRFGRHQSGQKEAIVPTKIPGAENGPKTISKTESSKQKQAHIKRLEAKVKKWAEEKFDIGSTLFELYQAKANAGLPWGVYVERTLDLRRSWASKLGRAAVLRAFFEDNRKGREILPLHALQYFSLSVVAGFDELDASDEGMLKALELWRNLKDAKKTSTRAIDAAIKERRDRARVLPEDGDDMPENAEVAPPAPSKLLEPHAVANELAEGLREVSRLRDKYGGSAYETIERAMRHAQELITDFQFDEGIAIRRSAQNCETPSKEEGGEG